MKVAASLINSGIYKTIAVVSSENPIPEYFEKDNMHTYPLFGALAAAAILTIPPPQHPSSKITRFYMETFGELKDLTTFMPGTSCNPLSPERTIKEVTFQMNGPALLQFVHDNFAPMLEKIQRGLSTGQTGDIAQIIPHQASGNGLKVLENLFGKDKVMTSSLSKYGNTIASGIPNALYEAIKSGRVKRGDSVLLIGSGAGVSVAGLKFIY